MIPGEGGREKGDASTAMLAIRAFAIETKATVVRRRRLSTGENDLFSKIIVDDELGILRAIRRTINHSIIQRGGGPANDGVLRGAFIRWQYNCPTNRLKISRRQNSGALPASESSKKGAQQPT